MPEAPIVDPPEKVPEAPKPDAAVVAAAAAADAARVETERKAVAEREATALRKRAEDAETEATRLKAENEARERKDLEDEGKWRELADRESKRADEAHKAAELRVGSLNERIATAELKARLAAEGIRDLDYHLLADRTKLGVTNGVVTGLDECVADLKARKPAAFGAPAPTTSAAGTPPAPAAPGAVETSGIKDVSKMSPEEYKEYKKTISRNMRRGRPLSAA